MMEKLLVKWATDRNLLPLLTLHSPAWCQYDVNELSSFISLENGLWQILHEAIILTTAELSSIWCDRIMFKEKF